MQFFMSLLRVVMKSGCFTVVAFGLEWKIEEKKTVFLSAGENQS